MAEGKGEAFSGCGFSKGRQYVCHVLRSVQPPSHLSDRSSIPPSSLPTVVPGRFRMGHVLRVRAVGRCRVDAGLTRDGSFLSVDRIPRSVGRGRINIAQRGENRERLSPPSNPSRPHPAPATTTTTTTSGFPAISAARFCISLAGRPSFEERVPLASPATPMLLLKGRRAGSELYRHDRS